MGVNLIISKLDYRRHPDCNDLVHAGDRQCAPFGCDGQLGGAGALVQQRRAGRRKTMASPLFSLHHNLFDRCGHGLNRNHRIQVSDLFSARTDEAKRIYELHDRALTPPAKHFVPAPEHMAWHGRQVFKGIALGA